MKVCEIFKSIEGEGIRMGQAAVFVRLHGCNLRCSYCDSMYAVEGPDFKLMSVGEVLAAVEAYRTESGVKCVTLTGGEPLIHESVGELLTAFSDLANGGCLGCFTRWTGSAKAAACLPG